MTDVTAAPASRLVSLSILNAPAANFDESEGTVIVMKFVLNCIELHSASTLRGTTKASLAAAGLLLYKVPLSTFDDSESSSEEEEEDDDDDEEESEEDEDEDEE